MTVVLYITEWIPIAITSTGAALLCIITGCITQKKAVEAINWNIIGRLAGCLGIAKALDAGGGTSLISQIFKNIFGASFSPYFLFCILILLVIIISEVTVGSTGILVSIPIVIAIGSDLGLNIYTFSLGITLAAGCALATPLASSTLGMSMVAGYKFSDYFKHNVMLDIINYIIIIIAIPSIYGLAI